MGYKQIKYYIVVLWGCLLISNQLFAQTKDNITVSTTNVALAFPLVENQKAASIHYDKNDATVVSIAAEAFKNDIKLLTNVSPLLAKDAALGTYPIIIGTLGKSKYIDELVKVGKIQKASLLGKWENFSISVVQAPFKGVKAALVIAGSDRRGTAFGVFELSRKLGVSPLVWWGDVKPAHKDKIFVSGKTLSGTPSVKYRGIFINDEDWGIQPWAAKNMDPDVKDLGPKAYTKVFELLLRLKANYIWPGMHPSTKAFYFYKDNPKIADQYAIVVGASHCEPMLRNNVFEWAENYEHEYGVKPGEWRYDLNKSQIATYWSDRVKESKNYESIYTVGMRGIHDGSMPGPKDKKEKVKLLGEVITDQRNMLSTNLNKPVNTVPQIFCPYKEVLSLYQGGLKLPDDVTIVWADDNHGYLRQLSNLTEQKRSGGSGVYYHISYWGTPHDYLWLSSISPMLISYELTKAFAMKADRVWIVNVGDIKPAEMETQFFMDLAWNVEQWKPENAHQYAENWAAETFGKEYAKPIAEIKAIYYRLGQSVKPEHMSSVNFTAQECEERLKAYEDIYVKTKALADQMPDRLKDAFFELMLYPVEGAYLMNQKILYAKKSLILADQGNKEALVFSQKAKDAFERIKVITKKYNEEIAGGKWNGMMDYRPRKLPVFDLPKVATTIAETTAAIPKDENQFQVIRAAAYSQKSAPNGLRIETIKGLGLGGNGVSMLPFTFPSFAEHDLSKAGILTYQVDLKAPGEHRILVKCLPTQGIFAGSKVRYAIGVNGEKPQIINISPASENNIWKQNVLQGFATGETKHQIAATGKTTIKIYLLDPGIVINQLEIQ